MHYTLVYADSPETSGPLVPFLWLFCLRSILLLIPDLPHCCPIKFLMVHSLPSNSWWYTASHQTSWAMHQWLPSTVQWLIPCLLMLSCHQYYSIPFAFLKYYSADDSLPYQSVLSCSLLSPLLSSLFMLPMLTHLCLSLAYRLLTKPLQSSYQSLTNPWRILLTPFSLCNLMLCPPCI